VTHGEASGARDESDSATDAQRGVTRSGDERDGREGAAGSSAACSHAKHARKKCVCDVSEVHIKRFARPFELRRAAPFCNRRGRRPSA